MGRLEVSLGTVNPLTHDAMLSSLKLIGQEVALDLVASHPGQVRLLVAHEAPVPALLPDAQRAEAERIQRFLESGARGPEWTEVMRKIAVDHSDLEPGVEIPAPTAQTLRQSARLPKPRD